jgi:large subunit ribosomal protein L27
MNFLGQTFRTNISVISLSASRIWSQQTRLATKKAGGSSRNGRDSDGKRLGVRKFGGQAVVNGTIIIMQRGQKYKAGDLVRMGRDHCIYSISEGWVKFEWNKKLKFQTVHVITENPNMQRTERPKPTMSLSESIRERKALKDAKLAEEKALKKASASL